MQQSMRVSISGAFHRYRLEVKNENSGSAFLRADVSLECS